MPHEIDYKMGGSSLGGAGLEWLSLIYLLYSLLLAAGLLVSLPYWLYQIVRYGKYRTGFAARMGQVPARLINLTGSQPGRVIWVHAVSVGEVLAVSGLVEQMRRNLPMHRVLVSTTTDTGQQLARKRFGEENVFYFPMDFAFAIRPYLRDFAATSWSCLRKLNFGPTFCGLHMRAGRASR